MVSAGVGLFYDQVPLSVYSFAQCPDQIVTTYNADGSVAMGPYPVLERPGRGADAAPFRVFEPTPGNFSPRSTTWNMQVEQPLTKRVKLRAGYMSNLSDGLVVLNRSVPDPVTGAAANVLSGIGQSRYRQLEVTARVGLGHERQLFLSYVHSRARGDLNEFNSFIGSFPTPIIRPNQFGNLPTNLPNRFLAWGRVPIPGEIRHRAGGGIPSGFPYIEPGRDPEIRRDPQPGSLSATFFSLDARLSKDIRLNPKYSVRLSVAVTT